MSLGVCSADCDQSLLNVDIAGCFRELYYEFPPCALRPEFIDLLGMSVENSSELDCSHILSLLAPPQAETSPSAAEDGPPVVSVTSSGHSQGSSGGPNRDSAGPSSFVVVAPPHGGVSPSAADHEPPVVRAACPAHSEGSSHELEFGPVVVRSRSELLRTSS